MSKLLLKCNLLIWLAVIVVSPAFAQNMQTVTGVVRDNNGSPIQNATVSVIGTSRATFTNEAGVFTISAKNGETIEVSNVGFEPVKIRVTSSQIEAVLHESASNTLGEVVVTGYGQTTRRKLTTAQTTVTAKDIEKTVNTTFDQALQGRAAGVVVTANSGQPGGAFNVNVRGVNSITGSGQPLYVIDGVQVQPSLQDMNQGRNPLSFLNPGDIENMEILQGPSATAVYGSQGTNGVVLVTTKKGKQGTPKLSYEFTYSLQDRPKELDILNLQEFTIVNNWIRNYRKDPIPEIQKDPSILGEGTNWQKEIFRRAPLSVHQVRLSGGTDKTRYYLSGERFDQEGVMYGSAFNRTGVRLNIDNTLSKWLTLGANINVNQTNDNIAPSATDGIRYAFQMPPYMPVRNADGSWGGYSKEESQYGDKTRELNPLALAYLKSFTEKRNTALGAFNATVNILKGLQFRTNLSLSIQNNSGENWTPTYQIGYTSLDKATLNRSSTNSFYWLWYQTLEYKKTFGQNHNLTLMGTHEAQQSKWDGLSATRTGFPANILPGGVIPSINLGDDIGQQISGWKGWSAMESYLGRLNYDFASRYFLTLTYRADGSSHFGTNNLWAYFPSGAVAWRVIDESFMKKQNILSDLKLRYEVGYSGAHGNVNYAQFTTLMASSTPWGNGFLASKYGNSDLAWETTLTSNFGLNLAFLKNRIRLDADFYTKKNDNLILTNPLPFYMGTSNSGSIVSPEVNIGAITNKGWAITLNTVNVKSKDVTWNTNFNISHNVATLKKLYQASAKIDYTNWVAGGGFIQRSVINEVPNQFYIYKYDGIFKSLEQINSSAVPTNSSGKRLTTDTLNVFLGDYKYADLNGDGIITSEDRALLGNPYPKFTFGFANDVTWKAITLSVLMTGSYGNKIYNAFRMLNLDPARVYTYKNALSGVMNMAKYEYDANRNPVLVNPETEVARYGGSNGNYNRASSLFVEDGSYLRIKNITLTYNIPASIISRTKIFSGAKIAMGVQNVHTFTKYSGFDPEIGFDLGSHYDNSYKKTFGVDVGQYPQTRSYMVNLGLNF